MQDKDTLTVIFSYIFSSDDTMRVKNRTLLKFIQSLIKNNEIQTLNRFLSDNALFDFHASLLKSTLIICNNLKGVNKESLSKIEGYLSLKL